MASAPFTPTIPPMPFSAPRVTSQRGPQSTRNRFSQTFLETASFWEPSKQPPLTILSTAGLSGVLMGACGRRPAHTLLSPHSSHHAQGHSQRWNLSEPWSLVTGWSPEGGAVILQLLLRPKPFGGRGVLLAHGLSQPRWSPHQIQGFQGQWGQFLSTSPMRASFLVTAGRAISEQAFKTNLYGDSPRIHQWMSGGTHVVHPYNGLLSGPAEKQNIACYNMNEPQKH